MATRTSKERRGREGAARASYMRIMSDVAGAGITRGELGKAVGASERTVHTWAAGTSQPSGVRAQRLLDVDLIVKLLSETYTKEGVKIWLNARNRNLNLQRPIDLIENGELDEVLEEANRISGGR